MTGLLVYIVLLGRWGLLVFTGCGHGKDGEDGEDGRPGSPSITAKGVTTAASGKRWANVDVEVSAGRARSPQVTLATDSADVWADSVNPWPIIGFGGAIPEQVFSYLNVRGENIKKVADVSRPHFDDVLLLVDAHRQWRGFALGVLPYPNGVRLVSEPMRRTPTRYFDPAGLDYNMLRVPIHATVDGYVFAEVPDDFELEHFDYNLTGDRENGKMEMLEEILKKKKDVKILGSAWSPPSWMKLGDHSMNGSPNPCLKRDLRYHKVWAKYLVTWVEAYERLGVPIWAITQQNEPQNYFTKSWATCVFEPEAQLAFIRDHLGPAMKAANRSTKLFVDGAAVHWYTFDQYAALKDYKEKYLDQYLLISTEATNSDPSVQLEYITDWDRAMHYVHGTIVDFVHGGSTVFMDWSMAGDRDLVTILDNGTIRVSQSSLALCCASIGVMLTRGLTIPSYSVEHALLYVWANN
ncbi:hypothetical protein FOZ60_004735 [Perkinsus olseni]|uniref:Glycosyl hydrolase family 30 TIM-barrel domain-containing protein n=1 Tax=Perkinsus olseni TaxID=32597 RepID=A0A7J6NUY7_PEROL|nr:hypothetical protein FOZ60_004735 [Perkinsus olseni]